MKKTPGTRPQDLLVLLKIVALQNSQWRITDLANQLFISQSEISEALYRNRIARLVDDSKRNVHRESLLEFLEHGVKYVFPARPGAIARGTPTAHCAPPLSTKVHSGETIYVWPDLEGMVRGETIEPLYPTVPKAAKIDERFYEMVALTDAIRIGRPREAILATAELRKRILQR
jgi:RNase P protein component